MPTDPKDPTETAPADLEQRFAVACARVGIVGTAQRRLIYRVLAESHDHPDAETVYQRVRERQPRVSLATVYRNLKLFAGAGIVSGVAAGGACGRYDANLSRHHHLICTRCDRVVDFYSQRIDDLRGDGEVARAVDGFEIRDLKVNVYGLCTRCREEAGEPGSTAPRT